MDFFAVKILRRWVKKILSDCPLQIYKQNPELIVKERFGLKLA
jgi:hypothetical protein